MRCARCGPALIRGRAERSALDDRGFPRMVGVTPAAPGLWFIGFSARPSLIGFVRKQSRRLAKRIAKELVGR